MPSTTPRQIGGVLLRPDAVPFSNVSLAIFRDPRAAVGQGGAVIVDQVLATQTGPAGEVSMSLVPGRYLGRVRLSDADRYFQFSVPDSAGPFVIGDLLTITDVNGSVFLTLQDLVLAARAWSENPEDVPVVTGPDEFSAKHYAAKAADIVAEAGQKVEHAEEWAQSDELISEAAGGNEIDDRSAKWWAGAAAQKLLEVQALTLLGTVDTFTGDGTTNALTLSADPVSEANVTLTIDGISQRSFTVSGTSLSPVGFSWPLNSSIVVQYFTTLTDLTGIQIANVGGADDRFLSPKIAQSFTGPEKAQARANLDLVLVESTVDDTPNRLVNTNGWMGWGGLSVANATSDALFGSDFNTLVRINGRFSLSGPWVNGPPIGTPTGILDQMVYNAGAGSERIHQTFYRSNVPSAGTYGVWYRYYQGGSWSPWSDISAIPQERVCTYGGSANAITLTSGLGLTAIPDGFKVIFRATATNTGTMTANLDGLGAKSVRTVTGVNTPSGYIRLSASPGFVTTEMRWSATGDYWIADRLIERNSNADGTFVRWADGTMDCTGPIISSSGVSITTASGGGFRGTPDAWTYRVPFAAIPDVTILNRGNNHLIGALAALSATSVTPFVWRPDSSASVNTSYQGRAIGRWY